MNWKGKSKDAFIMNNMIIYVENPKKFTLYAHTHTHTKLTRTKILVQQELQDATPTINFYILAISNHKFKI